MCRVVVRNCEKFYDFHSVPRTNWNGMVKLIDPRRGALAPPKESIKRFKTGWGRPTAAEPVPVFVQNGPF